MIREQNLQITTEPAIGYEPLLPAGRLISRNLN